jgi:hypothetical protein
MVKIEMNDSLYGIMTTPNKPTILSAPSEPLPILSRVLSHREKAIANASSYFERCQEGETILSNFFVDRTGWTTLEYYQKENGRMVFHRMEAQENEISLKFTYQSTDFKF